MEIRKLWVQSRWWRQQRSDCWHNDPKRQMAEWPRVPDKDPSYHHNELSTDDPEFKRDIEIYIQTALSQPAEDALSKLLHRLHSWDKLRMAVAWSLRFNNWFVREHRHLSVKSSSSMSQTPWTELSVDEVQVAEREIFRRLQKLSFQEVVEALQRVTRNQESSRQVKPGLRKLNISMCLCKLNPLLDGEGRHLLQASLATGAIHVRHILETLAQGIFTNSWFNDLVLVMDESVHRGNGLWPELFKFIAVEMDTSDQGIFTNSSSEAQLVKSLPFFLAVNDLVLVMDESVHLGNGLWPKLFKFIVVGMDTSDLWKYAQTPQRSLERFQNCAFMSMMNSKSVTD